MGRYFTSSGVVIVSSFGSKTLHGFFGQPPDVAIQYLENKQLVPSKNWYDIRDAAHNQAFTVANLARIDLLGDIKQSLVDVQRKGLTLEEWRNNITPTLQKKGWWGKDDTGRDLGNPWRLETIYRTNLQAAYMAGRRHEMLQATDTHPYWRYVAIMDNRTRPAHKALHGRVMRADDPAWDTIFPPCGWNCRCRVSPMTAGAVERGGYTIESSEGHLFTDVVSVGHNESANITRLKLPSMEIPFKTDAGFNAAPSTGATTQLIKKTAPDIIKQLPEHPVFSPSNATVEDFVKLGQQRLNDVLNIPATANKSIKEILESAKSPVDYLEHHEKVQKWVVRELERTRQAGTVKAEIKGGSQAKNMMKEATKGYPASWVKAANDYGKLNVKYSTDRGWAYTSQKAEMVRLPKFGVIKAEKGEGFIMAGNISTAVHEFAHRIQAARPDLDDLFQQEHRLRTKHEKLQKLSDLTGIKSYPATEVAKPDGYVNAYFGKEYKDSVGHEALEVMTMSLQTILGIERRDAKMLFDMYKKDTRMLELALGILFHCL